jgi:chloramphenicol-sensitive protein RarD
MGSFTTMPSPRADAGHVPAILSGIAANLILGFSSLFWKALSAIPPVTLLGYRILLSLVTLLVVFAVLGRFGTLWQRLTPRIVLIHTVAALLVVVNWGTFIWASIHGHVVESGLGYLIAPFVAIAAGAVAYGDRMSWVRKAALGIIVVAVAAMIQRSGELNHLVYLVIGLTWGAYACLKKLTTLDALAGLLCETVVLCGVLAVALVAQQATLRLPAGVPGSVLATLALCGAVSVLPLWLFSLAAARLPITIMGFFQFVLPITQLLVAVLVYHQPLSANSALCFGLICLSLLLMLCEPVLARIVGVARGNRQDAC